MADPKPRSGTHVAGRTVQGVTEQLPNYSRSVQNQSNRLANTYKASDKILNPQFGALRNQSGNKLGQLLGSINLNNANPEAERLVSQEAARTGNLGVPENATNTVANALSFGKEMEGRRQSLANALGTATGFLPATRTNFNPLQLSANMGQDLLGASSAAQLQQGQLNSQRRDVIDRGNETISAVGSIC